MDPSEKYKRKRRDKTTKNKTMVDMGASEKDKEFWTEKVFRASLGRLRSLFWPSFDHFWRPVLFVFLLRETVRAANKTNKNEIQSEKTSILNT